MTESTATPDQYSIIAAAGAKPPTRVLKDADTFAVFDEAGDVTPHGLGEQGLYHLGTRHLSVFELSMFGHRPLLLSSSVRQDNDLLAIDSTNPDIFDGDGKAIARDIVHMYRSVLLWEGVCYQAIRLTNYGETRVTIPFGARFDADFADVFEVRGMHRARRGNRLRPELQDDGVVVGYVGLDGIERRTAIRSAPPPDSVAPDRLGLTVTLEPQESIEIAISIECQNSGRPASAPSYSNAIRGLAARLTELRARRAKVQSENTQFDAWLRRSTADLQMMTTLTPWGPYPYAGVPWFSTVFGRDGIIAALQMLWLDPSLARGVLAFLAHTQAHEVDAPRDAEPGKIVHELRDGEMPALGEVPFQRYYGSVDATPLFVFLAGEYFRRTGDREFISQLWPALELAIQWMDTYGDPDRDGFIEYHRTSANGLVQQGWKDSADSVFHHDGTLADPPIALCEVQGYAYGARRAAADIAEVLGHTDRAAALGAQADTLRANFEEAFWIPELSIYALALDGRKKPCRVVSSNAGQCLLTGICAPDRAAAVAARLTSDDSFSGWGIRTLAAGQARYNPMSYHNGSVWPHDNAMIALGMGRYGLTDLAARVGAAMFDASQFVTLRRLPELFCGFHRRPGVGPTLYPVACAPQAWASGAVMMIVAGMLGLTIDAGRREVRFAFGRLPESVRSIEVSDLRVGDARLDLRVDRHTLGMDVTVGRRQGDVDIVVMK